MRVGIDLGGTNIYAIAVDDGSVLSEAKAKTPTHGGPLAVVDAIVALIKALDVSDVESVGVGAPAAVDVRSGTVRRAPNLKGWLEPFSLGPSLEEILGVPVTVDNDVNVGTLAEHRLGAVVGERDVLGLFVGTGVGGALILDGRIRRGPTGYAGEIGHMVVRPGGRLCGCGGRGHLEAYAGRAGMERRARQLESRGRDSVLIDLARTRRMTSSVFARALDAGDSIARQLVDRAVEALGVAVASAVSLVDVPLVVVGGGLADRLGAKFVLSIGEAAVSHMGADHAPRLRVVPATLGDRGGAIGAALASDLESDVAPWRPRSDSAPSGWLR